MKKIILSMTFALMGFASAFASKAYPGPITVIQSDGTELTVYLHGDENFSWYSTADGTLLVPVGSNYYIAQVEADGSLKATPQLAHNAEVRGTMEKQVVAQQEKEKFFHSADEEMQALAKSLNTDISTSRLYFPHTGNGKNSPKVLVLLVQFPNLKFTAEDPKTAFNYFLNSERGEAAPTALSNYYKGNNLSSVKQYFTDMSCGAFTPTFDIAGVVTVSKNYEYYGQEPSSGGGHDINCEEMVQEACKLAKAQLGVNFSDYDQNNDGKADLVYIIYAGLGQNNGGDANTLWAKTVVPPSKKGGVDIGDGEYIYSYGINSELNPTPKGKTGNYISGIGVFCHEFSHCMGIPDLYPYNTSAYLNNQEPEYWDLMDAGEYMQNGRCPAPYSPWELDIMGWDSEIETLDNTARQIAIQPYHKERKAYKIEASDGQYLLLQNIQNKEWWVGYPSHGLLIQRIDYNRENVGLDYKMNQTPGSPEVTILPADGVVISGYLSGENGQYTEDEYIKSFYGDPFPGSEEVTQLLEAKLNNNVVLTNLLYNIKEENGIITFDYLKNFTTGIDSPIVDNGTEKDARIYTLDGRYLGTDKSQLTKGVYIIGKKKVIIK